jgi:hypothetical protein
VIGAAIARAYGFSGQLKLIATAAEIGDMPGPQTRRPHLKAQVDWVAAEGPAEKLYLAIPTGPCPDAPPPRLPHTAQRKRDVPADRFSAGVLLIRQHTRLTACNL